MRFFRNASLLIGQTASFGWFILCDISFLALIPLIPLGLLYCYLGRNGRDSVKWLNGVTAFVSAIVSCFTVSRGVFEGHGFFALFFLAFACSFLAFQVPRRELNRISGWWCLLFFGVYIAMFIASLPGFRAAPAVPPLKEWWEILIFYLLVFIEPLSLGRRFRGAPLMLSALLTPFAAVAFYALGAQAFAMSEYPYLSVWAGVSVSAFHHIEGIILCLYYGVCILRICFFFAELRKKDCIDEKIIV